MSILEYIPEGHENGVTMEYLCKVTGLDPRGIRFELARVRDRHAILNLQDGKGYFIPLPEEKYLISYWIRQEEARAEAITKGLKGAKKRLEEVG